MTMPPTEAPPAGSGPTRKSELRRVLETDLENGYGM